MIFLHKCTNSVLAAEFLLCVMQAANTAASLEEVERKVLEYLIRHPLHLLPALLDVLGLKLSNEQVQLHQQTSDMCFACAVVVSILLLPLAAAVVKQLLLFVQIKELHVYHGNVTKSAELDCLFMLHGAAVVVSAKRSQGALHWQESFIDHLDAMWREWKQLPSQVAKSFADVPSLHLVAFSAGGGDIRGKQPSMYGEGRSGFAAKEVKCSSVLLHQLVARLPAWQFCKKG